MKLHPFSSFIEKYKDTLDDALHNSVYTEKYDTHYVKVKVVSSKKIICCKADGTPVSSSDYILNSMWANFISDWTIMQTEPTFMNFIKDYIGCSIGMFYFPCKAPLNITYNFTADRLYIIHQIYDLYNKVELPVDINSFNLFKTQWNSNTYSSQADIKVNIYKSLSPNLIDVLSRDITGWQNHCNTDNMCNDISDLEIVIKYNNKYYQLNNNKSYKTIPDAVERTSYEFILCDFIRFFNKNRFVTKLRGTYKQMVCQCFNAYIDDWEKKTNYIAKNIDSSALVPPHIGHVHNDNINSVYISNRRTLELCEESELYKNIFKVLLANLKSFKKKTYCVYMNEQQINAMNNIVRTIQNLKTDNYY